MGNPILDCARAFPGAASLQTYYTDASWIEGAAVYQLHQVAALSGVSNIAAFPDLHPGKYGPVGCAILADRLFLHLIGNDIGCGMSLFALDIPARKFRVDKAALKMRGLEGAWQGNAGQRLEEQSFARDLHPQTLGTIGGGNHFCEVQMVETIFDPVSAAASGLQKGTMLLLVHSGSRSFGTEVFAPVQHLTLGVSAESAVGKEYLREHDLAVGWAKLNRHIIAERAAEALRANCTLLADAPHNLVEVTPNGHLHRKGAAKADIPLVPLAGSRDALSYVLKPSMTNSGSLASLAHGAGRKFDRRSMFGRAGQTKSDREKLSRTSFGGQVICDDRQLLIEDAPNAYKDAAQVLKDLSQFGLAEPVVSLKPLVTFKKALAETGNERAEKQERLLQRRKER